MEVKNYNLLMGTTAKISTNTLTWRRLMEVKNYNLLMGMDPAELNKKVFKHLQDGWELYGSPIIDRDDYVYQAVVLQVESDD